MAHPPLKREEYLADLKKRALELVQVGDLPNAVALMTVGLNKREDTRQHHALTMAGTLHAMNEDKPAVEKWINAFS